MEVIRPSDDQIAIAEKVVPKPASPSPRLAPAQVQPRPIPEPAKSNNEPQEMTKMITPPPRRTPGFQPQLEKTKIDGAISNRGKAAVDAIKTPLGVYRKQVNAAIGSRWYFYVQQRRDLISIGSAKMTYRITPQGRITDIKVAENTSNDAFAMICEQSIREAEIGPPPEEATPAMIDGRLEGELTFTYYAGFQ
jgi:outer membrane biosynthesis protein TonB